MRSTRLMLATLLLLSPALAPSAPAGEQAYLGVHIEEEIEHPEGGARVTGVVADSPAAAAGIEEGDIIVRFDGEIIRGPVALTTRIHRRSPAERVPVTVLRDGRERSLEVELGERSEPRTLLFAPDDRVGKLGLIAPEIDDATREMLERRLENLGRIEMPDLELAPLFERWKVAPGCEGEVCASFDFRWHGRPLLGVELVETTAELRRHLGGSDEQGVLIGRVLPGMPAESAGVRVGDLILRVAGEPVASVAGLRRALARRAGETVGLEILRDGRPQKISVTLPDDDVPGGPRAGRWPAPAPWRPI